MQSALDVSTIICAYTLDRWDDLREAVDSVLYQTQPASQIVVVIDHNPDLLEHARNNLIGAEVIPNHLTRGLSGARNCGLLASHASVVAFLDDDARAAPDWLARLLDAYTSPRVIGVGGIIEPLWLGGRPAWFPDEFGWVVGCSYRGLPQTTASVRNLIGANMSFRTNALRSVSGFRMGFGTLGANLAGAYRCEETELCIRIRRRWPDALVILEPRARVQHRVPPSRGEWTYFRQRCYAEGLSKAALVRLVGASDALASERRYTLATLPRGIGNGFRRAIDRHELAGLTQAAAIVTGFGATAAGYARGRIAGGAQFAAAPHTW